MGYYTYFSLRIDGAYRSDVKKIWDYAREKCSCFIYVFGDEIPESCAVDAEEPNTWYYFLDDMVKISESFPHVLFVLHGEGDSPEDLWNAYFQNGKYQMCRAEIIYPEYDPSKMISFGEEEA